MHILLLQATTHLPGFGGAPIANRHLLEGLAEQGHRVTVVGASSVSAEKVREHLDEDQAVESVDDGLLNFRHRGVDVYGYRDRRRLVKEAAERVVAAAPDRVLVSSEDLNDALLEAAFRACPDRVVYVGHTTVQFPFGPAALSERPAGVELLRRSAGILTVSRYLEDYFYRWAGLEARAISFPVYGRGPWGRSGGEASRFETGDVTIVNPCALKGLPIFLELARAFPGVRFAAVPSWGTNNADRAALEALPNVEILGFFDDVDDLFARTRILLAPSVWREAFGQIAVEAMLRGVVVLASDAGGLPEATLGVGENIPVRLIQSYEDGVDDRRLPIPIVPPQDLEPWREALARLVEDRELWRERSAASRRAAETFVGGLGSEPFERFLAELPIGPAAIPS